MRRDISDHRLKQDFESVFNFAHVSHREMEISELTTESAGMNEPSQSVPMHSWVGKVMIGLVLLLRCGCAGELKQRVDVSEYETGVSLARERLM